MGFVEKIISNMIFHFMFLGTTNQIYFKKNAKEHLLWPILAQINIFLKNIFLPAISGSGWVLLNKLDTGE